MIDQIPSYVPMDHERTMSSKVSLVSDVHTHTHARMHARAHTHTAKLFPMLINTTGQQSQNGLEDLTILVPITIQ